MRVKKSLVWLFSLGLLLSIITILSASKSDFSLHHRDVIPNEPRLPSSDHILSQEAITTLTEGKIIEPSVQSTQQFKK